MVITRVKNGSADMILTAFDGKFDEKKDEIPPRACRPSRKLRKNNDDKVDHRTVEKKQCRKSGSSKVEKKQCRESGFIYAYIPSYTSTYIKILNMG